MKYALTKEYIESLQPASKDYVVWDKKQTGFGIKITPQGKRVYIYKYRLSSRKQQKYTIGKHGQMTLQQARKAADDIYVKVRSGVNPMAEKQEYKKALTVSMLCDKYIKEHAEIYKKPRSIAGDKRNIEKHVNPELGNLFVRDVTKNDVERLHLKMQSTPVQANHVRALLSKMFSLSEKWGIRNEGTNPVKYVKKYTEKPRQRYLSKEEAKRLYDALNTMDIVGNDNFYAIALIRVLWLSGTRGSEFRTAKWEWVNFERNTLELPDSKTGQRTIVLNLSVIQILKSLPRINDNPYIFPSPVNKNKPLAYPRDTWDKLRHRAKLQDFKMHDLRHTFASLGIEAGLSLPEIGKLLGHKVLSTTQRYAHLRDEQAHRAANIVGDIFYKSLEYTHKMEAINA